MRLEVLVDQEEPLIYPLNQDRIVVGSGENCDILIVADGISRKHVVIDCGVDEYFVIDQGSTNGTFINEERLVPGKRVEFTSFFPVRLGASTLLTLLSDEESEDFELSNFNLKKSSEVSEDSTRVIKRSELRETSSLSINTHRKKASVRAVNSSKGKKTIRKKVAKSKPEKNLNLVVMISIVVIIGAIYHQLTGQGPVEENLQLATPNEIVLKAEAIPALPVEEKFEKVSEEFIKNQDQVKRILGDMKCISNIEKQLCDSLKLAPPYGVTQIGRDVFIFVPATIDDSYKERLNKAFPQFKGQLPIAFYSAYLLMNASPKIPDEFIDYRIHLYFLDEDNLMILGGLSFYPKGYLEFKRVGSSSLLTDILLGGLELLKFTDKYFIYHDFRPPPVEEAQSKESLGIQ